MLLTQKTFFIKSNIYAYIMNKECSIDIDDEFDFLLADLLLKNKNNTQYVINIIKSIFSRQSLINILILNVFGLQIGRIFFSRIIYYFRKFNSDPEIFKYVEILKKMVYLN